MKTRPRRKSLACAFVLGTALIPAAFAETQTVPVAGVATTSEITGTVVVVDQVKRMLTIKTPEGRFEVIHVPDQVTRLDQVKIGNKLSISATEAVVVDLKKGKGAGSVGMTEESAMERDPGVKPSGAMIDTLTINGRVEKVDRATSQVTVRGPDKTVTLSVRDPAMLDAVVVGDGVTVTYLRVIRGAVTFN